jgi:capsular polysaccharide export protein
MDEYRADARSEMRRGDTSPAAVAPRSFLFLQGPISSFFDRLGRALIARGHRVHRINLHLGDQLFWRLPATHFRGSFEDWRGFVAAMLERHKITDLVLHGDRRPYHIIAAEEARARGIAVIATDLGYVRPDWITLERDGMTTYSRFPRGPAEIRALAAGLPEPDLQPRFHTPFWLIAVLDVAYNLGLVFGRPFYPHYRYHSIVHPFAEYAGWLWSRAKKPLTAPPALAAKRRLAADPGSYFLVPLQISTDFQIRAHSRFRDVREAVREIIASFAASGSRRTLVFVVHPLDNGLIGWKKLVARWAAQCGVAERAFALPGGTPTDLLRNAAGVITINSTVGVTALQHGVPVKVLGNAVFDVAGLTCQASLDAFWHDPPPPDPALMNAFVRALVGTTQVKGGYYEHTSQECAIAGFVERLETGIYPLPPVTAATLAARAPGAPGRSVVVAGASGELGVALARANAAPGASVCLIGAVPQSLAQTADDCRQRGARVDAFCLEGKYEAALAEHLMAFDRGAPVDRMVVHVDPAAEPADLRVDGEDIGGPLAAIVTAMRRRRFGEIVLVSNHAGQAAIGDPQDLLRVAKSFVGYAAALRRQLQPDGLSVAVVAPGSLAVRAAARLRAPELTAVGADRLVARIGPALRRGRTAIAVPGAAGLATRALRLAPSRLSDSTRELLLPSVDAIGEPADEAPLPGKTGPGD